MAKRSKVEPIRNPTLFEMDKLEKTPDSIGGRNGRPYDADLNILLGTSAFTAAGWSGSFYPEGTKPADYLSYYAHKFKTVEIDSTYYGTPSASTVSNWYSKTPYDFLFAAKVPQIITHDKILLNCEAEFDEFINRMQLLAEKLGPLLLQFPHFDRYHFPAPDEFFHRLRFFLKRATGMFPLKFAVEIRNPQWLSIRLTDLLAEHKVALVLNDTSFVPRPWEMKEKFDLITADFAYVRWLGDRKGIEKQTKSWDKTVVDRTEDLKNWVQLFRQFINDKRIRKLFAYANNHYAGNGPETVKLFWDLYNKE